MAAGSGFSGLLLLYYVALLFTSRFGLDLGRPLVVAAISLLVLGSLVILWSRSWQRITRLSQVERRTLVCLCWLLSLIDLIVFSWVIY